MGKSGLILCAALCAVLSMGGMNGMAQTVSSEAQAEAIRLIQADQPNDRRSVYWDGTVVSEVEDELDDSALLDGRGGPYRLSMRKAQMGLRLISADATQLLEDEAFVLADDAQAFAAQNDTRYLAVFPLSSTQDIFPVPDREALLAVSPQQMSAGEKVSALYTGLLETAQGPWMIGFYAEFADRAGNTFGLLYAGTGNYADIRAEAGMALEQIR